MIPKKIHYIWFGHGEKSDLIKKCINTFYMYHPDWEINEWTEDNYDINKCDYIREAYEKKMYAFASDYARFDILYKYGGIYLDTDVELLQRIPDDFLLDGGFTGVESNNKIAPGLIFACEPGNSIVKEVLEMYQEDHFIDNKGNINKRNVVDRVTDIFIKHGFQRNGKEQIIENNFHIYPMEFFCAYDFVTMKYTITEKTISKHHYTATWKNNNYILVKKIKKNLINVIGIKNYMKLIDLKKKIFGIYKE